MRLTRVQKRQFVLSVMADVPQIDYEAKANDLLTKALLEKAPKEVQKLYRLEPRWLASNYVYVGDWCIHTRLLPPDITRRNYVEDTMPEVHAKCTVLVYKHNAQKEAYNTLFNKVAAIIEGCATLKQAQERMPELVKYLPQPLGGGTPNLPSTTDVLDSLTKAGWPKGGE